MIAVFISRLLKVTAITFSGIAAGGASALVLLHLRDLISGKREALAFALSRVGFVIIVVLLAKIVVRLPELPPSGDVWWYVIGLVLAGLGYSWLAARSLRSYLAARKGKP